MSYEKFTYDRVQLRLGAVPNAHGDKIICIAACTAQVSFSWLKLL
jgi:hypothetical protein